MEKNGKKIQLEMLPWQLFWINLSRGNTIADKTNTEIKILNRDKKINK